VQKKILLVTGLLVLLVLVFVVYRSQSTAADETEVLVEAKFGEFIIDVTTSGELEAKDKIDINGPSEMGAANIYQTNIEDLVPEGTRVKEGDYVAQLDQATLLEKIKQKKSDIQQSESKYSQVRLDTTMELRKARNELINLQYEVKQKKIILEQSKFEPPATQQQAQIELEKAERAYSQAKENYILKEKKARAQMQEAAAKYYEDRNNLVFLESLRDKFTIKAPKDGMVIYERKWGGRKRGKGDPINIFDLTVATLPDLTRMISRTFVNEVDIRKVGVGQPVNLTLDAYPDKKLTGKVVSVANVGEQKPNTDAKVFQVDIEINESDTTLRPAMTTGNTIIAAVIPEVVFVPLEALHPQGDTLTYVIKKEGISFHRQEVEVGESNDDEVIIKRGLAAGDIVYLSNPEDFESARLVLLAGKQEN